MPSDATPSLFGNPGFRRLLIAQSCFGYAFGALLLLPKYLEVALDADAAQIGTAAAAFSAAIVFAIPLAGNAADRRPRRSLLAVGASLYGVATALLLTLDAPGPLLYACRALHGVAFSMAFVAGTTLAVDAAPPERTGQAISLIGVSMLAMNALAPAAVEPLAGIVGWGPALGTAVVACLVSAALAGRLTEQKTPARSRHTGFLAVLRQPALLRVAAISTLCGFGFGVAFTFHQPFALSLGIDRVSDWLVGYALAGCGIRLVYGPLEARWSNRALALVSLALYVLALVGLVGLRPGTLLLHGAVLGLAHGVFYPAYNAIGVGCASVGERGRVMALFQGAFNVGIAVGSAALGLAAERIGYPNVFAVGAVAMAVAWVALVISPDGRRGRTSAAS